ncbi:MAG: hypothetical protein ACTSPW_11140 [Promethearchaeota archaeon]
MIHHIKALGDAFKKEGESDLDIYLKNQETFEGKNLLEVWIDLNEPINIEKIIISEYDPHKEKKYLRGTNSGNNVNYSPFIKVKKNEFKYKNESEFQKLIINKQTTFLNFQVKLYKIQNKINYNDPRFKDSVVEHFFKALNKEEVFGDNLNELRKKIVEYYKNKFVKFNEKTKTYQLSKEAPTYIVFKIRDKNEKDFKYPGDFEAFKKLYLFLASGEADEKKSSKALSTSISNTFYCACCGRELNNNRLAKEPFSLGTFTTDQSGFLIGFDSKNNWQFNVCHECTITCTDGFNFLNEKLNFFVGKIKIGQNTEKIYHWLIPITSGNKEMLKNMVDLIESLKLNYVNDVKKLNEEEIDRLKKILNKMEKKKKQEIRNRIKNLEKEIKTVESEGFNQIDLVDLLNYLRDIIIKEGVKRFCILDFYYTPKRGKTKNNIPFIEPIEIFSINETQINLIGSALEKVKKIFPNIKFQSLIKLIGKKMFFKICEALFMNIKIDRDNFIKVFSTELRKSFMPNILKYDAEEKSWYHYNVEIFHGFYYLLYEMNLFK